MIDDKEFCRICGLEKDSHLQSNTACRSCWEIEHRLGYINLQAVQYFMVYLLGKRDDLLSKGG